MQLGESTSCYKATLNVKNQALSISELCLAEGISE